MDLIKLIDLVHGYKCLWDQSDTNYNLRDHQRSRWQEISEEMHVPVDELKKKWRGLRDTFGRELKKVTIMKLKAKNSNCNSKWPYYKHLLFLRDTMLPRDASGNILENEDMVSDADMGSEEEDSTGSGAVASSHYHETSRKAKRRRTDEIYAKLENNTNDYDAQFLLSLLPFLRDIPKHRKLRVRTKLQQVLIDAQDEEHAIVISSAVHLDQDERHFDTITYKTE